MKQAAATPIFSFEQVSLQVPGRLLIDRLSLQVQAGERLLIVGPNGAGKSSLLRLGHGLLKPDSGQIRSPLDAQAQGFVFQRPVMLRQSVLGNLAFALSARGHARPSARQQAMEHLASIGLQALASQPARRLSGGEQQRLALARAMLTAPRLLWLDEPTASLDPAASRLIEQQLLHINASGTTLVMVAHDLAQARRLAHRVALLHQGRLVELSPAEHFFERPATELGRRFIAGEHLA